MHGRKATCMSICESQEAHSEENQRPSSRAHSEAPHWAEKGGEGGGGLVLFSFLKNRDLAPRCNRFIKWWPSFSRRQNISNTRGQIIIIVR